MVSEKYRLTSPFPEIRRRHDRTRPDGRVLMVTIGSQGRPRGGSASDVDLVAGRPDFGFGVGRFRGGDLVKDGSGGTVEVPGHRGKLNEPHDDRREHDRDGGAARLDSQEDRAQELSREQAQCEDQSEHQIDRTWESEGGTEAQEPDAEHQSDDAECRAGRPESHQGEGGEDGGGSKSESDFGNLRVHDWLLGSDRARMTPDVREGR